eukprot:GHVT01094757.1.p3 GENE.GHVT01094757.1~~GHVT01094757.1.p3  ORF type:complete len:134 (-),score=6.48 GHVT01094757.1:525-926(-)
MRKQRHFHQKKRKYKWKLWKPITNITSIEDNPQIVYTAMDNAYNTLTLRIGYWIPSNVASTDTSGNLCDRSNGTVDTAISSPDLLRTDAEWSRHSTDDKTRSTPTRLRELLALMIGPPTTNAGGTQKTGLEGR